MASLLTEADATLEGAWEAFWSDARKMGADRTELRQAFKNGAAFIYGISQIQGAGAVFDLFPIGYHTVEKVRPWVAHNLAAHPGWKNVHRLALISGSFAAITLFCTGRPFAVTEFVP